VGDMLGWRPSNCKASMSSFALPHLLAMAVPTAPKAVFKRFCDKTDRFFDPFKVFCQTNAKYRPAHVHTAGTNAHPSMQGQATLSSALSNQIGSVQSDRSVRSKFHIPWTRRPRRVSAPAPIRPRPGPARCASGVELQRDSRLDGKALKAYSATLSDGREEPFQC
jgi:hypothetical protein